MHAAIHRYQCRRKPYGFPPQLRVDVLPGGEVRTSYIEFPEQALPPPLLIRAAQIDYFDVRFPSILWGPGPTGTWEHLIIHGPLCFVPLLDIPWTSFDYGESHPWRVYL